MGQGKPILFLHGGRVRAKTFSENIKLLSKNNLVIAPDIPGHGNSSTPKDVWSFIDYAKCFDLFLKKISIKDPIVIGYSFGGGIAFNLAAVSKNISKLVLIDSDGFALDDSNKLIVDIRRSIFYLSQPQYYNSLYKLIRDSIYHFAVHFSDISHMNKIRYISKHTSYNVFDRIKVSTLILWAKDDRIFPVRLAHEVNYKIKGSKLLLVEGNHDWILYDPASFYKEIQSSLR